MVKTALRMDLIYGTSIVAAMMAAPAAAYGQTSAAPAPEPQIGSAASQASHILTASVLAQSATDTPQVPETSSRDPAQAGGVQTIVVTARRREESVQSIPVSVQAITAEEIQQRDLTSLEKIAAATPNFTIARASNGAGAQLTLRGIGSSATSIGIEQSVAIVVDSVYYGQGRIINEGFFDLARVEVLKGPQSLFFGKNATAGVISLTTADPGLDPEYIGRVGYEFAAERAYAEAIVSQPLTDTLGVRVAVRGSRMWGGYYTNQQQTISYPTLDVATGNTNPHSAAPAATDQPQERELIGRITLKYEPDDRLTARLKVSGSYNRTVGNGWNYAAINCPTTGQTTNAPNYPCTGNFVTHQNDFPLDIAKDYPFARDDGGLYNTYKSWAATGSLDYALDDVTISSITNYNWNNNKFACDCDFLSAGVWATENASYHAFSQELRVLTDFDAPVNLMVGGLYQKTRRDFFQAVMFANLEDSSAAPANRYVAYSKQSRTDGETLSGYGQLMWQIAPTLEATGGVRYIHETKDSNFTQPYVNAGLQGLFLPTSAAVNGTIFGDQTFNDWSPDFTLRWRPTDDVMLYGAYRVAYKSGGFSNSAINSALSPDPEGDLTFNPEKGKGYEIGIKSTLVDNQLQANLTYYNYKYTDLQVDFFNSAIFAYITYNAGSARSEGVELELEYAPYSIPGLRLRGNLNYNKARYEDFIAPCYGGQSIAAGCSLNIGGVPSQDLSGVATAVAPKWTGTAGIAYETELSSNLKLGTNIDMRYSGSYIASSFGDPGTTQSSYAVLDAGIRIGSADDRWQLALIGKNLTNKFYFTGGGTAPSTGSGTGTAAAVPGDNIGYGTFPRTVSLQGTVRF
ncbi:MAG: iron complex outermembrane receptor protein [Parasphingorhabdus sp.]|jgi:iron complex outermembrane receptor protein|uniref:TonB-dependent receptor n=1 Tax=Parasphingorhabdus sp. TaxID=2709688 RepID=UPI002B27484D|nr:TonB-dependent receptor [Parasphingorhabdus sp.]